MGTNRSGTFLKVEYDKWLHFMAGYIVMMTVSMYFGSLVGLVAVLIVAWLKEIYDEYRYGGYDSADIKWTIYGLFPAQLLGNCHVNNGMITNYDLEWLIQVVSKLL